MQLETEFLSRQERIKKAKKKRKENNRKHLKEFGFIYFFTIAFFLLIPTVAFIGFLIRG